MMISQRVKRAAAMLHLHLEIRPGDEPLKNLL